jgi:hypothetical protein
MSVLNCFRVDLVRLEHFRRKQYRCNFRQLLRFRPAAIDNPALPARRDGEGYTKNPPCQGDGGPESILTTPAALLSTYERRAPKVWTASQA